LTETATVWFSMGLLKSPERRHTMADTVRMALQALLRKAQLHKDADVLREGMKVLGEALMELELTQ
jgi:hypothetical protein